MRDLFLRSLNERMLDLYTSGDCRINEAEYREWVESGKLSHLRGSRAVKDCVAAAFQDAGGRGSDEREYRAFLIELGLIEG